MSDMLFGAVVLVLFLIVVFVVGYFYYKFRNARLTNAWGPLVALVNGKVVGDGGGGATSWLSGTVNGRPIVASMSPNINTTNDDSSGPKYNYFDVALTGVPGAHDWNIDYGRAVLGMGQTGWRVSSKDAALRDALTASSAVSLVAAQGEPPAHFMRPPLEYSRSERTLRYRADITPQWVPTPQRFTEWAAMLQQLADLNAQHNQPA